MRSALSLLLSAALLAGCASHPKPVPASTYTLPDLTEELRSCFAGVVDLPPQAEWDAVTTAKVITDLRKSEAAKTSCGRRLIQFYDDTRREASGVATK